MTVPTCFPLVPPARRASVEATGPSRLRRVGRGPRGRSRSEPSPINGHDPDLWLYRERTLGILRRYQRLSVEVGRLPSLLGREFFRTRVTSYHAGTFEDAVIFVHDVARGLEQLGEFEHKLIARIALQDYTQRETARSGLLAAYRGPAVPGGARPDDRDLSGFRFIDSTASQRCCPGKKLSRGAERGNSCNCFSTEGINFSGACPILPDCFVILVLEIEKKRVSGRAQGRGPFSMARNAGDQDAA